MISFTLQRSMQTKGGQQLRYHVQIYFEVLGGYRGQQHSLKLWNSVRGLETKINTKDTMLISQKNQINVNNIEVSCWLYIPGYTYSELKKKKFLFFAYAANIRSVLHFQDRRHR